MKKFLFSAAFLGLFLAACWFTACQKDMPNGANPATDLQVTDRANGDSKVFPPTANPYGKSYTDWTKIWVDQFLTYDCSTIPWVHPENVLFYTSGPVYMLAGIAEVGGSASITVPHGKALLFALVNVWWDYPCPEIYGFVKPEGVTLADWLTGLTEETLSNVQVSNLSVTVDGASVSNMGSYKFVTDLYDFTGNPDLATCFDPCITGGPQPVVGGGYYVMLKPLSKGQHTVHYHMGASWGEQDATYNITVQ